MNRNGSRTFSVRDAIRSFSRRSLSRIERTRDDPLDIDNELPKSVYSVNSYTQSVSNIPCLSMQLDKSVREKSPSRLRLSPRHSTRQSTNPQATYLTGDDSPHEPVSIKDNEYDMDEVIQTKFENHVNQMNMFPADSPMSISLPSYADVDSVISSRNHSKDQKTMYQSFKLKKYGYNVLIVDDVLMNRKMLCRLLEQDCDQLDTAADGLIAVELVKKSIIHEKPYDFVFMDYQMPNMDGPTAVKQMREIGYNRPVIGVTGNVLDTHIKTFLSHGANKIIEKPVNYNRLKAVMQELDGNK